MAWTRTVVAFLLSFTLAFGPVVSVAMVTLCTMTSQMMDDGSTNCPCQNSMPNCGSMPQCRTITGCANQCTAASAVMPSVIRAAMPGRNVVEMRDIPHLASLSIRPATPPPRV